MADSLQADADRYLQELQDTVAALDAAPEEVDFYVSGPTLQSKGITILSFYACNILSEQTSECAGNA